MKQLSRCFHKISDFHSYIPYRILAGPDVLILKPAFIFEKAWNQICLNDIPWGLFSNPDHSVTD